MMHTMRRRPATQDPELIEAREETSAALERTSELKKESAEVRRRVDGLRTSNGFVIMFTKLMTGTT